MSDKHPLDIFVESHVNIRTELRIVHSRVAKGKAYHDLTLEADTTGASESESKNSMWRMLKAAFEAASPPPTITAAELVEKLKEFCKVKAKAFDDDARNDMDCLSVDCDVSFLSGIGAAISHLESLLLKPLEGKENV